MLSAENLKIQYILDQCSDGGGQAHSTQQGGNQAKASNQPLGGYSMQLFRVIKTPFVMVIIDNLPDDANYELAESKIRTTNFDVDKTDF